MEKLQMQSPDLTQRNVERIAELFPSVITETKGKDGTLRKAINFEQLQQLLSNELVEGHEAYEFTWVGKREATLRANTPTRQTLRPCPAESTDWETTQNLYIEGDNLEVLKTLQESYYGKVKMIYIDPPYNTGKDFIYHDDFAISAHDYALQAGDIDGEGTRLRINRASEGRFHSAWCSMIYPRLLLSRSLLTDDGVIFISIDDNEVANMRKMCDEVFGERNFLAQVIWERAYSPVNLKTHFSPSHDYIICYAKDIERTPCNGITRSEQVDSRYSNPDNDPRGVWSSSDISVGPAIPDNIYTITTPSGREVEPPAGRSWRLSRKAFRERLEDNRIWFGPDGNGVPRIKRFLSELRKSGVTPMTIWKHAEVGHSQDATQRLAQLFDGVKFFDYPKPVQLIKLCLQLYTNKDSLILDFFSGSATTAHAVMQLNAEDGGKRRWIMVQLPETCAEGSEAAKAGYSNICEIGKERIRRAGRKIKEENPLATQNLDTGFRVLRLASSNMEDRFYSAGEWNQEQLEGLQSTVKSGRTGLDLLFASLLEMSLPLSLPLVEEQGEGHTLYSYGGNELVACLDTNIPESLVRLIAARRPLRVLFREEAFASTPAKISAHELLKQASDEIHVRVI